MFIYKSLQTFGRYLLLMGRTFSIPERFRMFWKQYVKEMSQLGIDSIGIVLLISFFIGAVICIQMKVNIESPWMPRWVAGYTTREIMLLEFSSSIMCLILSGKVGSNIASELGTMRVTQHRRPHRRIATFVQPLVYVHEHYQESVLCFHYLKRCFFLRLYCGRRLSGSR